MHRVFGPAAVLAAGIGSLAPQARADAAYALVRDGDRIVKAPLFAPEYANLPVAKVVDRVVTLRELSDALGAAHTAHTGNAKAGRKDFTRVLDRLIAAQLVVREAREMGIDTLPEVRSQVDKFRESSLRRMLRENVLRGVKPDPADVEKRWKDAAEEWKVRSVLFQKEEDAKAMLAAVHAGRGFDAAADEAIASKKASGSGAAGWLGAGSPMLPQVRFVLANVKPGQVSPVVKVDKGFAVLRIDDIRYSTNPKLRADAEAASSKARKEAFMQEYYLGLVKKYAKVDEKLLAAIDFEAKSPGFDALKKDSRPLVRIEGQKPITIGDLASALEKAFFHGIPQAIKEKRVNEKKLLTLDGLIGDRVFGIEIAKAGFAESGEYKRRVSEFEDEAIFGTFVEKVIVPEVNVTEADTKKYYEAHKGEFTYPAFYTLQSVAFSSKAAAQAAVDKLNKGTDFKWLKANSDDQVPAGKRSIDFDGGTVSATSLPPKVLASLAGAQSGAVRLHDDGDGQYYVLYLKQYTPPTPQPYAEAREAIAPKIADRKMNDALEHWIAKLRGAYEVKVYITKIVS